MAHTASVGSVKRTVNVIGKRLGLKKFGGEYIKPGDIILRQRGSQFYPGRNVAEGRDFTIFAVTEGFVSFRRMSGYKRTKKYIDVVASVVEVKADLKAQIAPEKEVVVKPKAIGKKPVVRKTTKKTAE